MARRAGLDAQQIAALGAASPPAGVLDDEQTLAVEVTRSVLGGEGVAAAQWRRVVDTWGVAGALELIAVIGWWGAFLPTVLGALGLDAPDAVHEAEGGS
jgi:hypothetical protein